jgi:hypothetical protein
MPGDLVGIGSINPVRIRVLNGPVGHAGGLAEDADTAVRAAEPHCDLITGRYLLQVPGHRPGPDIESVAERVMQAVAPRIALQDPARHPVEAASACLTVLTEMGNFIGLSAVLEDGSHYAVLGGPVIVRDAPHAPAADRDVEETGRELAARLARHWPSVFAIMGTESQQVLRDSMHRSALHPMTGSSATSATAWDRTSATCR